MLQEGNLLPLEKHKKKDIQYAIELKAPGIQESMFMEIESQLGELEKPLQRQINEVLDVYDSQQLLYKDRLCHSKEQIDMFTEDLRKTLPPIPNPFENCRNIIHKEWPDQNVRYAYPKDMNPHMVYELKKCKMIQDNDAKTEIKEVVDEYSLIRLMASRFRCMAKDASVGAP